MCERATETLCYNVQSLQAGEQNNLKIQADVWFAFPQNKQWSILSDGHLCITFWYPSHLI